MIEALARRRFADLRQAATSGRRSARIDLDEDINLHDERLDGRMFLNIRLTSLSERWPKATSNHSRSMELAGRHSMALAGRRGAWHTVVEHTAAEHIVAEHTAATARPGCLDRQFRVRLDSPERAGVYSVAGRQQFGPHSESGRCRGARHPGYRPFAVGRCRDIPARMPGCE
jgi:hypothetical protein